MRDSKGRASVLLAMGSNLSDPLDRLKEAVAHLRSWVEITAVSSVYRTEPVGFRDQPDFLNLVCRGTTPVAPLKLLDAIHQVEREMGRTRSFRNAPRLIDIDLLAYGDQVLESPELTLPHPRLHERGFVLVPLAEIAPAWRHPVFGRTAAELLRSGGAGERVERWRALDG